MEKYGEYAYCSRVLRVKCFLINLKVTNKQFKYVILLLFFCNTACSVILCAL